MFKVAIKGVFARRLRFLLTTLAVALGVMLMAGSYIFTDTFSKGFDQLFANAFKGIDVSVSAQTPFDLDQFQQPPTMPESALAKVKAIPGVQAADGSIFDQTATILDKKGKPITLGQAPQSIASTSSVKKLNSFDFPEGRAPRTAGEVALDQATADRKDFKLGDTVSVQGSGNLQKLKLVGLLTLGGSGSIGGSSIALVTLPEAQALTGKEGRLDSIAIAADAGVAPEVLQKRIAAVLGPKYDVKTGKQEQEDQASDVRQGLNILRTALTVFAGIALFVGAFLIFNTFSITVTQRLREIALLRTLGASRGQVLRSVLTEGLVIGAVGSSVGLGLGILIAIGLKGLLSTFGIELPSSGLVLEGRTVVLSLGIGIAITLVSALIPAVRATRIPPIAALQEGAKLPRSKRAGLIIPFVGGTFVAIGIVLIGLGLQSAGDDSHLLLRGAGALIAFIGFGLFTPRFVVPLASVIGRPAQAVRGLVGRLARENTMREPGRTAITTSALMIGVALVTFALIFTSSIKATLADALQNNLKSQAVAADSGGQFQSFPTSALDTIAKNPKVSLVTGVSSSQGLALLSGNLQQGKQSTVNVSGLDPRKFPRVYKMEIVKGPKNAISLITPSTTVVDKDFAKDNGLKIGSVLNLVTPTGDAVRSRIIATKTESGPYALTGEVIVPNSLMKPKFGVDRDVFAMVDFKDGVDVGKGVDELGQSLEKAYPRLKVQTDDQFQKDQEAQINAFLGVIFALLALSIIVAIFGIVNTLVLAISERTRELGLLRAIGTSRRQVRTMVRYEAVITALIGTVLGTVVGVVIGTIVVLPASAVSFAIPVSALIVVLILGAIVGVFAAIWPARRASRLNVLEALSYE